MSEHVSLSTRRVMRRPVMVASTRRSIMMSILVAVAVMLCVPTQSVTALSVEKAEQSARGTLKEAMPNVAVAFNKLSTLAVDQNVPQSDFLATVHWSDHLDDEGQLVLLFNTTSHTVVKAHAPARVIMPIKYPVEPYEREVVYDVKRDKYRRRAILYPFDINVMRKGPLAELYSALNDKVNVTSWMDDYITFNFHELRHAPGGAVFGTIIDLEWFQFDQTRIYMETIRTLHDFALVTDVLHSLTDTIFSSWVSIDVNNPLSEGDVNMSFIGDYPQFFLERPFRMPSIDDAFTLKTSIPECGVAGRQALRDLWTMFPREDQQISKLFPSSHNIFTGEGPSNEPYDPDNCRRVPVVVEFDKDDMLPVGHGLHASNNWKREGRFDGFFHRYSSNEFYPYDSNFGHLMTHKTVKSITLDTATITKTSVEAHAWRRNVHKLWGGLRGNRFCTISNMRQRETEPYCFERAKVTVQWVHRDRYPVLLVKGLNVPAMRRGTVTIEGTATAKINEARRLLHTSGISDQVHTSLRDGSVLFQFNQMHCNSNGQPYGTMFDLEWFQIDHTRIYMEAVSSRADYAHVMRVISAMADAGATFKSKISHRDINGSWTTEEAKDESKRTYDRQFSMYYHEEFPEFAIQDLDTRLPSAADAFTLKTSIAECSVAGRKALRDLWHMFPKEDRPAERVTVERPYSFTTYHTKTCRRVPVVVEFGKDDIRRMKLSFGNMMMHKTVKSITLDTATITKDSVDSRAWEQNVARLWDGLRGTRTCEISPTDNRGLDKVAHSPREGLLSAADATKTLDTPENNMKDVDDRFHATVQWASLTGELVLLIPSTSHDLSKDLHGAARFTLATVNSAVKPYDIKQSYDAQPLYLAELSRVTRPFAIEDARKLLQSPVFNDEVHVLAKDGTMEFQFYDLHHTQDGFVVGRMSDLEWFQIEQTRIYMETITTEADYEHVKSVVSSMIRSTFASVLTFVEPELKDGVVMHYDTKFPRFGDGQKLPSAKDQFSLRTSVPSCGVAGRQAMLILSKIFPNQPFADDSVPYNPKTCKRVPLVVQFGVDDIESLKATVERKGVWNYQAVDKKTEIDTIYDLDEPQEYKLNFANMMMHKTVKSITLDTATITKDSVDSRAWEQNVARLWDGLRGTRICQLHVAITPFRRV